MKLSCLISVMIVSITNFGCAVTSPDRKPQQTGNIGVKAHSAQPDTQGPDVLSVSVDKIIKAGEIGKIRFKAVDDISGILDFQGTCAGVYSVPDKKYNSGFTAACGSIKSEGTDTYTLDVRVGEWVSPGKYGLYFDPKNVIEDRARNKARSGNPVNLEFEVTK